ncbi:conserved hypothetical protein [Brochothrix thermosphacta]|nr:hypothetical protein FM106_27845 [Brachybacterium faecium]SOC24589.1 conserved hypothetical protein [Brochothrix thermosphacta]SPP28911.1 conserved hypothetical protein [Brochothrix thermosphacta]
MKKSIIWLVLFIAFSITLYFVYDKMLGSIPIMLLSVLLFVLSWDLLKK